MASINLAYTNLSKNGVLSGRAKIQVTGQVTGHRSQVTGYRSQVDYE